MDSKDNQPMDRYPAPTAPLLLSLRLALSTLPLYVNIPRILHRQAGNAFGLFFIFKDSTSSQFDQFNKREKLSSSSVQQKSSNSPACSELRRRRTTTVLGQAAAVRCLSAFEKEKKKQLAFVVVIFASASQVFGHAIRLLTQQRFMSLPSNGFHLRSSEIDEVDTFEIAIYTHRFVLIDAGKADSRTSSAATIIRTADFIRVLRKHPLKLGGQQQEICHKCKAITGTDLNFGAFNGCSILNVLGAVAMEFKQDGAVSLSLENGAAFLHSRSLLLATTLTQSDNIFPS
ncbi:hypothetical protein OUZ56_013233 [Daphnia magna]|uniref:Uncharacterized protein n=1 Tax=Daphnia magna TaxID=35525 RepID=A0ABQ9Z593_9CRUS|nr:hypothetical protein OUZ56_013233 [Daphnia magna]